MNKQHKPTNIVQWIKETFVIFVLPAAFVLYVDYKKCFPYDFARWLWKGTRNYNSPHIQDGFLYGVGLALSASLYYGLRFLFKK
jgi:hypothetical protein